RSRGVLRLERARERTECASASSGGGGHLLRIDEAEAPPAEGEQPGARLAEVRATRLGTVGYGGSPAVEQRARGVDIGQLGAPRAVLASVLQHVDQGDAALARGLERA